MLCELSDVVTLVGWTRGSMLLCCAFAGTVYRLQGRIRPERRFMRLWDLRSFVLPDRWAEPSGDVESSPIAEEKQASVFGNKVTESRWPKTSLRRFGESIPDWLRPRRASFRFPSLCQNATVAAFSHHCLIKAQNCGMNEVGISPFERNDVQDSGSSFRSSHSSTAASGSERMQMACMIRF